jgi:hypothetical protein
MKVIMRTKQPKGEFVAQYIQVVTKEYLDGLGLKGGQPVEYALCRGKSAGELKRGYYEGHDDVDLVISTKAVIAGNTTSSDEGHMFHFSTYGSLQFINLESLRYFLAFARPDYRQFKMEGEPERPSQIDAQKRDITKVMQTLKKIITDE